MKLKLHTFGLSGSRPLVIAHGMGGTGALYKPIARDLESDFYVLAPDQRGHGESQHSGGPWDPTTLGADLVETLPEVLRGRKALGVGHSMGVRSVVEAAALAPELWDRLVLVDLNFTGLAGGGFGDRLRRTLEGLPASFDSRAAARTYLDAHNTEASIAQFLMAVLKQESDGNWLLPFDRDGLLGIIDAAARHSLLPSLHEIERHRIPVLVMRGALSTVWTREDLLAVQARFPSFECIEVPGAGHGVPFEQRTEFIRLLRKFAGSG